MCLDEQMTDLPHSGGGKGCILGTALSGDVTAPWHVNHTYELDVGGLLIETFPMTSEVLIERIDVRTISFELEWSTIGAISVSGSA